MSKASNPWMKFYPSDWRADPALRVCSLAARGLWVEMLCIMHEATPRGYLTIKGHAVTEAQLAALSGASLDEITSLIGELETMGVFSRDGKGCIYSRRILRDEKAARTQRNHGNKGGNPKLKGGYNKPGYVYLMGVRHDGKYKIGISVNPRNRVKKVRAQYPRDDIQVLDSWFVDDMGTAEEIAHGLFGGSDNGEWFSLSSASIGKLSEKMMTLKGPVNGPQKVKKPEARSQKPEEEKKASPKNGSAEKRGTRLPANWIPSEQDQQLAISIGMTEQEIRNELAKFQDYWAAKPGKDGRKLDWGATWRNWIRRAADGRQNNGPRRPGPDQSGFDGLLEAAAEYHSRYNP